MKNLTWILLFVSSFTLCEESYDLIPISWLKKEVDLDYIHSFNYRICQKFIEIGLNKNKKCELGKGNVFSNKITENHKIYYFDSPEVNWKQLAGESGFALVENKKVVEVVVTSEN